MPTLILLEAHLRGQISERNLSCITNFDLSKALERAYMKYTPPSPASLQRLKDELGKSSVKMAELFGLSSGRHWRSYTGDINPRTISAQTLFFGIAQLELDPKTMARVLQRMREAGAEIDLSPEPGETA